MTHTPLSPPVDLRRIRHDDVANVVPLHHELWHRNAAEKRLPESFSKAHDVAYFEHSWFTKLQRGEGWLAETATEIVGFFHVGPAQDQVGLDRIVRLAPDFPGRAPDDWWEVSNFYVGDRGHGVGTLLLSAAEHALEANEKDGALWALNPLVDLHNFYVARQWNVLGFGPQEPTEGDEVEVWAYGKTLDRIRRDFGFGLEL